MVYKKVKVQEYKTLKIKFKKLNIFYKLMNKTILTISLSFMVIIFIVFGFFLFFQLSNNKFASCEGFRSPINCERDIALTLENYRECENLVNPISRIDCYKIMAIQKKDARICDEMFQSIVNDSSYISLDMKEYSISTAKNVCYQQVAIATRNSSICNEMPREKDSGRNYCYYLVAVEAQDSSNCTNIATDNDLQKKCYEDAKNIISCGDNKCAAIEKYESSEYLCVADCFPGE